jgi:tRNA-splicing ligase RtcB (3'-phosphate/5'-hydroxy nucleic acid ligase)
MSKEVLKMKIEDLKKVNDYQWEVPRSGDMKVPGEIFSSAQLVKEMDEKVKEQVSNVACLPGIVKASLAMPDAHWGYGFPIGGVGAFDSENGVVCMGGVGFDISCGVRTLRTTLMKEDLQANKLEELANALFRDIPAGLGSTGEIRLNLEKIDEVLLGGAIWAVEKGYGTKDDLKFVEEEGRIGGADPKKVSMDAKKRQYQQVGTLGSGNHYLEVQYVDEIIDEQASKVYGLKKDQVIISLHCGSRALGHQIGTDYLKGLGQAVKKYNINIRDRELACAPVTSEEGISYFAAMNAGVNCALANRQVLTHLVRGAVESVFKDAKVETLYDISHNTCKLEEHEVDGKRTKLYVHRKGATRALGPGRPEVPERYKDIGQPVLIGGTMGTCSYILCGTEFGTKAAWGSACHGAGRNMSRTEAIRKFSGENVVKRLQDRGILIRAHSKKGIAEEAPDAYKDVTQVVDAVDKAGLAKKVAMVKPMACVKG